MRGHVTLGTGGLLTRHDIGSTRWQGIEGLCLVVASAQDCATMERHHNLVVSMCLLVYNIQASFYVCAGVTQVAGTDFAQQS
jgi:hypothetical protein